MPPSTNIKPVPLTTYILPVPTISYLYLLYPTCTSYNLSVLVTSYNNLPTQLSLDMFTVKQVSEQHLVSDQCLENKNRINAFYYSEFPNPACFGEKKTSVLPTWQRSPLFDKDLFNPIKQWIPYLSVQH